MRLTTLKGCICVTYDVEGLCLRERALGDGRLVCVQHIQTSLGQRLDHTARSYNTTTNTGHMTSHHHWIAVPGNARQEEAWSHANSVRKSSDGCVIAAKNRGINDQY